MSLIEISISFAMAMALAVAGLFQINVQGNVINQQRTLAFYVNEGPRITRAIQQLVSAGSDVSVYDVNGGNPAGTGQALKVSAVDPITRQTLDTWIAYSPQYRAIQYQNINGNSWYLGHNIENVQFTMNPDGTVSMYVQQTSLTGTTNSGAGIESLLERR